MKAATSTTSPVVCICSVQASEIRRVLVSYDLQQAMMTYRVLQKKQPSSYMLSHHPGCPRAPAINVVDRTMPASERKWLFFLKAVPGKAMQQHWIRGMGGWKDSLAWWLPHGCFFEEPGMSEIHPRNERLNGVELCL